MKKNTIKDVAMRGRSACCKSTGYLVILTCGVNCNSVTLDKLFLHLPIGMVNSTWLLMLLRRSVTTADM